MTIQIQNSGEQIFGISSEDEGAFESSMMGSVYVWGISYQILNLLVVKSSAQRSEKRKNIGYFHSAAKWSGRPKLWIVFYYKEVKEMKRLHVECCSERR